jgi:hypothetical protein
VGAVRREPVPEGALLRTYWGGRHPQRWGTYYDCFSVDVAQPVGLGEFVYAFYTSPVFRVERLILRLVIGARSTDADARAVADGSGTSFAAWIVGERTTTQLLMCDRFEKTRSWFRVLPLPAGGTKLQFGSGIVEQPVAGGKRTGLSIGFRLLLGFHIVYSRVLLWAASQRVETHSRLTRD